PVLARQHEHRIAGTDLQAHAQDLLKHLRRKRYDAHEILFPQLPCYRAEDAGPAGLQIVPEQDGGIVVEFDVGAVGPAQPVLGADDDRPDHVAPLHHAAGSGFLDGPDDNIADAAVTALGTAQDLDHHELPGARVVRHVHSSMGLNHRWCLLPAASALADSQFVQFNGLALGLLLHPEGGSLRVLQHFYHPPPLVPAERAGFHN